jgi:hypothetical protein
MPRDDPRLQAPARAFRRRFLQEGWTLHQIATEYGFDVPVVLNALRGINIDGHAIPDLDAAEQTAIDAKLNDLTTA